MYVKSKTNSCVGFKISHDYDLDHNLVFVVKDYDYEMFIKNNDTYCRVEEYKVNRVRRIIKNYLKRNYG